MLEDRPLTDNARRLLLKGSDAERREGFAPGALLVSYPEAQQVHEVLEEILTQPRSHRPLNLLLTAESGNGKTAILDMFARRFPRRDNPKSDAIEVPIIKIDAPANKRLTTMYIKILEVLAAPNVRRISNPMEAIVFGSTSVRQPQIASQAVLRLLRLCGVRLVIFDEVHSLAKENTQYSKATLNWIKSIPNETRIPLVLCGDLNTKNIAIDPQFANRFDECTLPEWKKERRTVQLLADLEVALPLKKPSRLREPEIANFLMEKCDGTIGSMVGLIEKAGARAVGGVEEITLEGLERAVGYGCRRRLADFRPSLR